MRPRVAGEPSNRTTPSTSNIAVETLRMMLTSKVRRVRCGAEPAQGVSLPVASRADRSPPQPARCHARRGLQCGSTGRRSGAPWIPTRLRRPRGPTPSELRLGKQVDRDSHPQYRYPQGHLGATRHRRSPPQPSSHLTQSAETRHVAECRPWAARLASSTRRAQPQTHSPTATRDLKCDTRPCYVATLEGAMNDVS